MMQSFSSFQDMADKRLTAMHIKGQTDAAMVAKKVRALLEEQGVNSKEVHIVLKAGTLELHAKGASLRAHLYSLQEEIWPILPSSIKVDRIHIKTL